MAEWGVDEVTANTHRTEYATKQHKVEPPVYEFNAVSDDEIKQRGDRPR
eukprot:CAMPEP_0197039236 /NCGR_PEP_ID=MMETSP1384-20130603/16053_1 /TAXON_ID=29189 /ORGANISM="Ammonia sp." /LENGTH=48 /DNA_ID= /DNA_START= /DNA_END= /DNA_ORIENTATION=